MEKPKDIAFGGGGLSKPLPLAPHSVKVSKGVLPKHTIGSSEENTIMDTISSYDSQSYGMLKPHPN